MESTALDPNVTYITPVDDGLKLSRHQAFYQRNARRLKQEARESRYRYRKHCETLPQAEQDEIKVHCRQINAAYRERHRDELRVKERLCRQHRKAATGQSQKI